jgi:hypothetical protein
VTVTSVNDNPTAANDTASVVQGSTANAIAVLANDGFAPDTGETLTVTAVSQGGNGSVAISGGGTGVVYSPNAAFAGTDTFTYTVADGNGGSATGTVTVTVLARPTMRINDVSVTEGDSGLTAATFTVTLSHAFPQQVSANYQTFSGSAREVRDYISTSGQLTVPANAVSGTITVNVVGETTKEKDETFSVRLSGASNATITRAEAIGFIRDDDSTPTASVTNTSTKEGNPTSSASAGTTTLSSADAVVWGDALEQAIDAAPESALVFTVRLSNASEIPISVDYATLALGSLAGVDFEGRTGTLTFGEDETMKQIVIPIVRDRKHEALERVMLKLSNPVELVLANTDALGDIIDDDPAPTVSVSDVSVVEGNTGFATALFRVTLSEVAGKLETVSYSTANGTAMAGSDYTAVSGVLTFLEGVTELTVSVPVVGDIDVESAETLVLNITSVGDATVEKGVGVATIVSDDVLSWSTSTAEHFSAGTLGTAYLALAGDGELTLRPRAGTEFSGTALPTGWTKAALGTVTFSGQTAALDGTQIQNIAGIAGIGQTLEFVASFSGAANQHAGLTLARFIMKAGGMLYAQTLAANNTVETLIGSAVVGMPHRFRINWTATGVVYSIDGAAVVSHPVVFAKNAAMTAVAADLGAVDGSRLVLDWVRQTPYVTTAVYESAVFNAGAPVLWQKISLASELPIGTSVVVEVRVDGGLWVPVAAGMIGTTGTTIQYRLTLASAALQSTPEVSAVTVDYLR